MAVNTAKQKCPTMSIGSQQSACDATTEVEVEVDLDSAELAPAGSGSACPVCVGPAMAISAWCSVWAWTRWCMPTRPNAMATISNH